MNPLLSVRDWLGRFTRDLKTYLLGKGVVSTAVFVASFLSSGTLLPYAMVIGGVALQTFFSLRSNWRYQDDMTNRYREEISMQLGLDPAQVTRAHLRLVAYGNEEAGIPGNRILAQAIERRGRKSWLNFGAALLAGATTLGMLTLGMDVVAASLLADHVGGFMQRFGVGAVAMLSGLVVQNSVEFFVGRAHGITAPSAHDQILALERQRQRGRAITPAQIFSVVIAADPTMDIIVQQTTGKSFAQLNANEKARALKAIDTNGEMQRLAGQINRGELLMTEIPFVLFDGGASGAAPPRTPDPVGGTAPQHSFTDRVRPHGPRTFTGHFADHIDASRSDTATQAAR